MAGDAAGRFFADGTDGVGAASRTDRPFVEIGRNVFLGWHVRGGFALFQSPFIFGGVNLPEIVDAGIFLRGGAGTAGNSTALA